MLSLFLLSILTIAFSILSFFLFELYCPLPVACWRVAGLAGGLRGGLPGRLACRVACPDADLPGRLALRVACRVACPGIDLPGRLACPDGWPARSLLYSLVGMQLAGWPGAR